MLEPVANLPLIVVPPDQELYLLFRLDAREQSAFCDVLPDFGLQGGHRSFLIGRAATLLEVLERNAVPVPSGCRAGECGDCAIEVTTGTVRDLITGELLQGRALACAVMPVGDVAIKLRTQR